jgi:hypothetical protein
MLREEKLDLAWENFRRCEQELNSYLASTEYDLERQKQLTEAVKSAMDKVLDEMSLLWTGKE